MQETLQQQPMDCTSAWLSSGRAGCGCTGCLWPEDSHRCWSSPWWSQNLLISAKGTCCCSSLSPSPYEETEFLLPGHNVYFFPSLTSFQRINKILKVFFLEFLTAVQLVSTKQDFAVLLSTGKYIYRLATLKVICKC